MFEKLERIVEFEFTAFGRTFEISNTVLVTWIIMAVIILLAGLATRDLSADKPSKVQCLAEWFVEAISGMCKGSIGHHWKGYAPYLGTLILYLGVGNIIAIFNFFPGIHLYPPTRDINVTGTLAAISILIVLYSSFRYKGFGGWAKSLIEPTPIMAPFKLLEYGTKPLSLCLRLFGNIVASFLIMEILLAFFPIVGAPFSIYFDLFDGVLQAFIFVYLTSLYIGEAVE